jgi:cytochrome P450
MTVQDSPSVTFPFPKAPSLFDPGPDLRALLESERPVVRAQLPDGSSAWLVAGYAENRQVLIDARFSRAAAAEKERTRSAFDMFAASTIIGMDPPDHTRIRKLVTSAFTMRRVESLRPGVAAIASELLDDMIAGPRPADLIRSFSLPLPVRVICELLGVPATDQERFRGWSDSLVSGPDMDMDEAAGAVLALSEYFAELIALKRRQPGDDLMTALIAARDNDDRLSEAELVTLCITILVGGHETTANQIVMSLLTLLAFPAELERLRADLSLIPGAIEELMRFVQLGSGGYPLGRVATEDVDLGGVTIAAGDTVLPFFLIANRDGSEFPDPDRLDVSRQPQRTHMSFGAGVHHCLGAQLARMELQEAYRAMLTRLPGLRLAVPLEELRFKPKMLIYSLYELPVVWDAGGRG